MRGNPQPVEPITPREVMRPHVSKQNLIAINNLIQQEWNTELNSAFFKVDDIHRILKSPTTVVLEDVKSLYAEYGWKVTWDEHHDGTIFLSFTTAT